MSNFTCSDIYALPNNICLECFTNHRFLQESKNFYLLPVKLRQPFKDCLDIKTLQEDYHFHGIDVAVSMISAERKAQILCEIIDTYKDKKRLRYIRTACSFPLHPNRLWQINLLIEEVLEFSASNYNGQVDFLSAYSNEEEGANGEDILPLYDSYILFFFAEIPLKRNKNKDYAKIYNLLDQGMVYSP